MMPVRISSSSLADYYKNDPYTYQAHSNALAAQQQALYELQRGRERCVEQMRNGCLDQRQVEPASLIPAKPKTFRAELQLEINDWLKGAGK